MTVQLTTKNHYIELLRKNGFNCFPVPINQKVADHRYDASRTKPNQTISKDENYGYIPLKGCGTCIIDFDDKERYRKFAGENIQNGFMVIETPHGWHIPVTGLTGEISKIELFDYKVQDKKIIEIQGYDHYCVGPESKIYDNKTNQIIKYVNRGSDTIWNAKKNDFHWLIENICRVCKVTGKKRTSRSSNKNLRDRFLDGKPPTEGSSNDYFFQAAIQCNTDGLDENEALEKIRRVYDKWTETKNYSHRPFSNIEAKIREVYEKNLKLKEGRPTKEEEGIDRTLIAQDMVSNRKLYSNVVTREIYENQNGFLVKINDLMIHELVTKYPDLEESDYKAIVFKIVGLAKPYPETNKNLIVFKNTVFDLTTRKPIESEEIADMGFSQYNYLEKSAENEPKEFLKIMFGNVPEEQHARIKAGLRAILTNRLDPKISVIYGKSGIGKSTGLNILVEVLGDEYALAVELDQFLQDKFIRAKIKGLRLLVLQDMPQTFKDYTPIKTLTGEQKKTERGFMQDSSMFDNKLKIWGSANYLAKIPEHEKNPMYSRRLSLVHNIRKEGYPENPTLYEDVAKNEGEKIISWIVNLSNQECQYENAATIRREWEKIASPEIEFLDNNYICKTDTTESEISVMSLVNLYNETHDPPISLNWMKKTLENQGYIIKLNVIKNIRTKTEEEKQQKEGLLTYAK